MSGRYVGNDTGDLASAVSAEPEVKYRHGQQPSKRTTGLCPVPELVFSGFGVGAEPCE